MTKLHDELAALHEPRNVFGKPLAVSLPIDLRDRIQSALQEHEAQAATIQKLEAFIASIAQMPDAACKREETIWELRDKARKLKETSDE